MNNNNLNIIVTDSETSDAVAFPVTPEKLGRFISGLLGQPQTISREVSGLFDVDLAWLLHVHSLIEQRIKQQNDAVRTAFKATIYYDDNFSRTLETYEGLQHFSETKKIRSTGVKIEWTYIIRFPGKDLPEKQEITLRVNEKASKYVTAGLQMPIQRSLRVPGLIAYSIAHTERTWGDDIESILRQEIDQVTKKTKWYEPHLENTLIILGFALLLSGFLFPDYMNDRIQNQSLLNLKEVIAEISPPNTSSSLNVSQKLDIVIRLLDPRSRMPKIGITYRVVSAIAGFAMMGWCLYLTDLRRSSFVVLTREAEENRRKVLQKEQRRFLLVGLSFLASIAAGVFANYVYLYLMT